RCKSRIKRYPNTHFYPQRATFQYSRLIGMIKRDKRSCACFIVVHSCRRLFWGSFPSLETCRFVHTAPVFFFSVPSSIPRHASEREEVRLRGDFSNMCAEEKSREVTPTTR